MPSCNNPALVCEYYTYGRYEIAANMRSRYVGCTWTHAMHQKRNVHTAQYQAYLGRLGIRWYEVCHPIKQNFFRKATSTAGSWYQLPAGELELTRSAISCRKIQ